jgi:hypothetical protein
MPQRYWSRQLQENRHPTQWTHRYVHGHGHGHGIFILATHPEGTWTTNPNPLSPSIPAQTQQRHWYRRPGAPLLAPKPPLSRSRSRSLDIYSVTGSDTRGGRSCIFLLKLFDVAKYAGMIGFITLQQSAPSQMTWQDSNASNKYPVTVTGTAGNTDYFRNFFNIFGSLFRKRRAVTTVTARWKIQNLLNTIYFEAIFW